MIGQRRSRSQSTFRRTVRPPRRAPGPAARRHPQRRGIPAARPVFPPTMKTLLAALARLAATLVPVPVPVPVRIRDGRPRR